MLADTKRAAIAVIEAFNSLKPRLLCRSSSKKAKAADIRAFVVDGRIVGAMKRQGN